LEFFMRPLSLSKRIQAGFTLIELIVVIVIIGILAAVALPKLAGLTDEANKAKNTAVLGALKSAWTFAYAQQNGNNPTAAQVAAEMSEPACSAAAGAGSAFTITCGTLAGATLTNTYSVGGSATVFSYTPTTPPTPNITCSPTSHCK
jgi:prepilin-type N-terminal cleavage/methylation domain-containing protein